MKIFLDTNIFIRFLTRDDEEMFDECKRLFELILLGKIIPYTSNIVLLEITFILTRQYKFPKKEVRKDLEKLINLRNLTIIELADTKEALKLFGATNIKFSDCYIATQVPKGVTLITYDSDFRKIPSISAATPDKVILIR